MNLKMKIIITTVIFSLLAPNSRSEEDGLMADREELFKNIQVFADAITLISAEYAKPVEVSELVHGAIKGMMDGLDGYSQFLDEDAFEKITVETKGEFGGIGIRIGIREGVLTVISPLDGTPADEKGLEPGDKIVKIGDEVTRGFSLDEAVKLLRGEPGTEIELTILRESTQEVLEVTIERAIIKIESIRKIELIEDHIGYIRLSEFQKLTPGDFRDALNELMEAGAKSLILDLRNNPGGLLDAAVDTADLLLREEDVIVYTEGRDATKRKYFTSEEPPIIEDLKLIVLVNQGSASASEILAGAVRDNARGLLLGKTTFGKGSVQTVIPLKDGSALRLSTAAYFTPAGHNLMEKGIVPDVVVEQLPLKEKREEKLKEQQTVEELFGRVFPEPDPSEDDIEKEPDFWQEDNQLLTAVNIMKGLNTFLAQEEDRLRERRSE